MSIQRLYLSTRRFGIVDRSRSSRGMIRNEFHISRRAREKYQLNANLFASSGNVIFADFFAARQFARKMNEKRDLISFPEQAVRAGQINAMGLIDEILHYVVELYREQVDERIGEKAFDYVQERLGADEVEAIFLRFIQDFPPLDVYTRKMDGQEYLAGTTGNTPNRQLLVEELLLLWLANVNPAFSPYLELYDDADLEKLTRYHQLIKHLDEFFQKQPKFGPNKQPLVEMLRSPAQAQPHSLSGQLQYMVEKWGILLGKYLYRLLGGLDLIKEEEKIRFGLGPGPTRVVDFRGLEEEPERFSPDKDWMPRLVLMAKSTLVWLDQLSKKYNRPITRLDEIPDEELDQLACWGFTGLWLIGVWQRSPASKKIKQMCGNPDAESSAYSLYDYTVAEELGGEPALLQLKQRCWKRGIRLASDMVPNHTGIYSRWVIEHPDWFLSRPHSPFPSYSFQGANLSEDPRVGIFIEDHYYERSDAAVVFKRVDFYTGDERYIYHGNDGTSMPWNDTAQLNYLKPEVREAVIQTILHVARLFSIIRFDAAMTLTKRHYQRLWFPEPGTGGDIPSRAEHAMTRDQFNGQMPVEFWREVVDRIAQDAPDTLLLAEAFWLMEGYFVRTLGMHRVYNSAFMNMLKNEENEKYRNVIKKTIEFNPEILKRYVNFMNNPDEETAVAQFGKGDKYLGTCIMMVTMPGLPMFGHGQVEGYTEKYGMEFRRAYWDEQPDYDLIYRHERYVFPLMKKRHIFAQVENFLLYDFYTREGFVNENVFAYSNRCDQERALVVYNNKFEHASGWIRTSTAFALRSSSGEGQRLEQRSLGEGLLLHEDDRYFTIFRDHISGLEYIRNSKELHENGMYIELGAFHYHVFWEFREVQDDEQHHYSQLSTFLAGRGVPDIEEAMKELFLRPLHQAFVELVNADTLEQWMVLPERMNEAEVSTCDCSQFEKTYSNFIREVKQFTGSNVPEQPLVAEFGRVLQAILKLACPSLLPRVGLEEENGRALQWLDQLSSETPPLHGVLYIWAIVRSLGKVSQSEGYEGLSRTWIDEWLLGKTISSVFQEAGFPSDVAERGVALIKILTSHQHWFEGRRKETLEPYQVLKHLLSDQEVQFLLRFNRYGEVLWFQKEAFETFTAWLFTISLVDCLVQETVSDRLQKSIAERSRVMQAFREAEEKSAYQVDRLLQVIQQLQSLPVT